jgi:ribosomal protein S18 acetylase RimI-like enzyme
MPRPVPPGMTVSPPLADVARLAPPGRSPSEGPRAVVGDWVVELARPEDDPAIRRLVASNPVPGRITLGFEREPSYFAGCRAMGPFAQVAVARHRETGAVGAVACRAVRLRFVNGSEQPVGYLSQLRVDRPYRGRWLGTAVLRALPLLHADGRTEGYLATITDGNEEARGLLVGRARRGLPAFRPVARLHTLALHVRQARHTGAGPLWRRAGAGAAGPEIVPGTAEDTGAVVSFLRREGRRRQFFPALTEADLGSGGAAVGPEPGDVVIARRGGQIAGAGALWDQGTLKQTVVRGYGGALRWLRPAYNLGARLLGAPAAPLPAPGSPLRSAYACFLAVAQDDPLVCRAVLRSLLSLAAARGLAYVLLGLAEGDPLLDVGRRFPHVAYGSTLYTVRPAQDEGSSEATLREGPPGAERLDGLDELDRIDERPAQVEIATL